MANSEHPALNLSSVSFAITSSSSPRQHVTTANIWQRQSNPGRGSAISWVYDIMFAPNTVSVSSLAHGARAQLAGGSNGIGVCCPSTKTECDYLNGWITKRLHTRKSHPKWRTLEIWLGNAEEEEGFGAYFKQKNQQQQRRKKNKKQKQNHLTKTTITTDKCFIDTNKARKQESFSEPTSCGFHVRNSLPSSPCQSPAS